MNGGYYKVDIDENLSVLVLNSQYYDIDDETQYQADESTQMLDWLEYNLADGVQSGRKFIISDHVYAGARYHANDLWHSDPTSRYFQILLKYAAQIVIEVVGHDHIADLRYHTSTGVLDFEDPAEKFRFHNVFVAPGITPEKGNNPGVSMFEVSADGKPSNLKFEFIDVNALSGKSSASYDDLKFLSFDLAADLGFSDLSPDGLSDLRKFLEDSNNYDKAIEYLVRKMGFDANDDDQVEQALAWYIDKDLVTTSKHKIGEFLCQMHKSISSSEIQECFDSANNAAEVYQLFLQ